MRFAKRLDGMRDGAAGPALIVAIVAGVAATGAQANVTISSQPTQNMTCSSGLCAPTAKSAVLNVGDLETDLATGNVTVTTTGAGIEADNLNVKSPLSWATANTLALAAHRSVTIDAPISVVGQSGLSLQTGGSKGMLAFGSKGSIGFSNLSSQLSIEGVAYTLVGNVKTLAASIAANPSGTYALAGTYDASADGTYRLSPIGTVFTGTFEGLGNVIMNLNIDGGTIMNRMLYEGLFVEVGTNGVVQNISLTNAMIVEPKCSYCRAGPLVALNLGWIEFSYAAGTILANAGQQNRTGGLVGENVGTIASSGAATSVDGVAFLGALVGVNDGTINASHASGEVVGEGIDKGVGPVMGGLVGDNFNSATISNSFATGTIVSKKSAARAGGLVGTNEQGTIVNSYATGSVKGITTPRPPASPSNIGGLVGENDSGSTITYSYSTGAVAGSGGDVIGGLIGYDYGQAGSLTDTDWDTDTSGITNLSQGAGTPANDPGITGLSTTQLQSGLPAGFDSKVWAEKPNINGGLPYLLANPPAK